MSKPQEKSEQLTVLMVSSVSAFCVVFNRDGNFVLGKLIELVYFTPFFGSFSTFVFKFR